MDRPGRLPDDVAEQLEDLDRHELREASRYAERLAEQRERSKRSGDPDQILFSGGDGDTYYETGGIWGTIELDTDK